MGDGCGTSPAKSGKPNAEDDVQWTEHVKGRADINPLFRNEKCLRSMSPSVDARKLVTDVT